MTTEILSAERLRKLLHYDPETGSFTRLVYRTGNAKAGDTAGSLHCDGYTNIGIDMRYYLAHRLAWLYMHGHWPTGQIDHINGKRTDNRFCNLREATNSLNQQNQRRARSNNKSGLLGVSMNGNSWQARIRVTGKTLCFGTFATPELAHAAYIKAKRELHTGGTI